MTRSLPLIMVAEVNRNTSASHADDEPGFGALRTEKGHLPLEAMDVRGRIDGLFARVLVRQTFVNAFDEPLEAAYIFPLPDRAAVTHFRMTVAGREIAGVLEERGRAREHYEEAIAEGRRAAIAEEDRPGVFNLRVGNLMPGERATVELTLCGVLPYADGEVTFRFPMVVAPRYIPGRPLPGPSVGDGTAVDTVAVPDASRISPPVLLPGFPNPVRLSVEIELHDGAAGLDEVRSSLHAVQEDARDGYRRIRVQPGERLDRDFILRFRLGGERIQSTLTLHPDRDDPGQGTFALTVVPPAGSNDTRARPRDVAFLLDRSGSMEGWKLVAARRALARMIDTLGEADRFHLMAFDSTVEVPTTLPEGLTPATDRARFRAVEYLATVGARGGTEMAEPLDRAVNRLTSASGEDRDRILVLITDGQIANEDQVLKLLGARLDRIRVFAIGIDRAVNEGFLRRLAERGGGSSEFVESEDRLDGVMSKIHRRIGTPLLTGLRLEAKGLSVEPGELVPRRLPDLFVGSPLLILGRYRGSPEGAMAVTAKDATGTVVRESVSGSVRQNPAIAAAWARGQIRQLEDRYAAGDGNRSSLEKAIVAISLRFQVLCRFTAYVAVDRSHVVNPGGTSHRITQPVERPAGWAETTCTGGESGSYFRLPAMMARGGAAPGAFRSVGGPPRPTTARGAMPAGPDSAFEPRSLQDDDKTVDSCLMDLSSSMVEMRTLEEVLAQGRRWDVRQAAAVLAEIAEAVEVLHGQKRVHGDLSPANVPMRDEAHPAVAPLPDRWLQAARRPVAEALAVTPYTAPERLGDPGGPIGPAVDVYSLGVILYELLTGQNPFRPFATAEHVARILKGAPTPPRQVESSIPAELEAICLKAMAKEPRDRFATAGELAAALRRFLKPRRGAFWR